MPRQSKEPRYYPTKNGWFMVVNGERIRLTSGPKNETRKLAWERYRAEMGSRLVEEDGDRNYINAVLNSYLNYLQNRVDHGDASQNTFDMHAKFLKTFNEECGALLVRQLRPQHITDWIAKMRQPRWSEVQNRVNKWGDGSARKARDVVSRVFNWAKDEAGIISRSPLDRSGKNKAKKQRRRPSPSRVALLDAEYDLLMEYALRRKNKDFAHLLTCLYRTGCRPAEMHGARADEWDEEKQAIVIKGIPENRGRFKLWYLGEDRVLYVPDDLVPLLKAQMEKYPTGTIFRTETGAPWTNATICSRFKSIKRAANKFAAKNGLGPVRKGVTAYSPRHRYVTVWIEQDRPVWKLCELLNTSETMLRTNYSHLFERTASLRDALNEFDRRGQETAAASASTSSKL
jgi:integrase